MTGKAGGRAYPGRASVPASRTLHVIQGSKHSPSEADKLRRQWRYTLELCNEKNVSVVARSPFARKLRRGGAVRRYDHHSMSACVAGAHLRHQAYQPAPAGSVFVPAGPRATRGRGNRPVVSRDAMALLGVPEEKYDAFRCGCNGWA
jgi:hypothetical protein